MSLLAYQLIGLLVISIGAFIGLIGCLIYLLTKGRSESSDIHKQSCYKKQENLEKKVDRIIEAEDRTNKVFKKSLLFWLLLFMYSKQSLVLF